MKHFNFQLSTFGDGITSSRCMFIFHFFCYGRCVVLLSFLDLGNGSGGGSGGGGGGSERNRNMNQD